MAVSSILPPEQGPDILHDHIWSHDVPWALARSCQVQSLSLAGQWDLCYQCTDSVMLVRALAMHANSLRHQ
jgi:hypothetical protein